MQNNQNKKVKKFIESYPAESKTVPIVIDNLLNDLKEMGYPKEEIDEIILSMDEALTNAIQETLKKETNIKYASKDRLITVVYIITEDEFETTIIDHGKGFNFELSLKNTPDKSSNNYFEEILHYSCDDNNESNNFKNLKIKVNGCDLPLKGIGAGLKIMSAFMDTINIELIDKEKVISNSISPLTDGTILTMKRKRRY